MLLDENWKIESDELNVTLYERYVSRKSGREYWRPHSYYSSVANALKGLVNIKVNRTGMRDLETVQKEIDKLHQLIDKIEPAFITQPITRNVTACKKAPETSLKGNSTLPPLVQAHR